MPQEANIYVVQLGKALRAFSEYSTATLPKKREKCMKGKELVGFRVCGNEQLGSYRHRNTVTGQAYYVFRLFQLRDCTIPWHLSGALQQCMSLSLCVPVSVTGQEGKVVVEAWLSGSVIKLFH